MSSKKILIIIAFLFISVTEAYASSKLLGSLPRTSYVIGDFSVEKLQEDLRRLPLHHVEGIWRYTAEMTEIAIVRRSCIDRGKRTSEEDDRCYNIVLIRSDSRALRPGTVMGLIVPSAKNGVYEARIYTRKAVSSMFDPRKFILRLSDDGSRLVFDRKKSEFSVNLWHFVPYLWRYSVRRNVSEPSVSGCIRIFPEPDLPVEPRYL
ncbi:MAG: hypothetical protein K2G01_06775 [Paramuribaculum sp.]|nr:hypothetical protein [Paramuribaculum sp.]